MTSEVLQSSMTIIVYDDWFPKVERCVCVGGGGGRCVCVCVCASWSGCLRHLLDELVSANQLA